MTQNADQCHLLKSINLQCCQSFGKFLCTNRTTSVLGSNTHLAVAAGRFIGSCRLGTQNAQDMIREHWWKILLAPGHVRILQELQRKNPAGQNCTTNSFFLWFLIWWQEWWRLVTKHFWMKNPNSLWSQVFVEMYPFEIVINHPLETARFLLAQLWLGSGTQSLHDIAVIPAWQLWLELPGQGSLLPSRTSQRLSLLCFHPAMLGPFGKPGVSRSHWWLLETKLCLSYISKTIVISSPVGSFAISVFQNFLLNKLFVPSFANPVNKWGRGVTTLVLSGLT